MKKRAGNLSFLKRVIVGILATFALFAISVTILVMVNTLLREAARAYENTTKADLLLNLHHIQQQDANQYADRMVKDVKETADVMGAVLEEFVGEDGYTGPRVFTDGAVIELRDGAVVPPDGAPADLARLKPDQIKNWADSVEVDNAMITVFPEGSDLNGYDDALIMGAARITDDTYYVTWSSYFKTLDDIMDRYGANEVFHTVELAFDGAIFIVDTSDSSLPVIFNSGKLPEVEYLAELGINADDLLSKRMAAGEYEGESLEAVYGQTEFPHEGIVLVSNVGTTAAHTSLVTLFIAGIMMIAIFTFGCYLLFSQKYARDKILDERHAPRYAPKALQKMAVVAVALGSALILIVTIFVSSVSTLYERTTMNDTVISGLFEALDEYQRSRSDYLYAAEERWFVEQAQRIAGIIAEYPDTATPEMLRRVSNQLGCDYVMLFDSTGRESMCSTGYTGFTLGNGQGEHAEDFRRLLRGIPSVYHSPSRDTLTGLLDAYAGVTIPSTAGKDTQGALVLAIPDELIKNEVTLSSFDDLLTAITPDNAICYAMDSQTGQVLYASADGLAGTPITELGFPKNAIHGGYLDFVNLPKGRYYVRTDQQDSVTFLYGTTTILALTTVMPFSLMATVVFAVVMAINSFIMLFGYTKDVFEDWVHKGTPIEDGQLVEVMSPDGKRLRTVDPSRRWSFAHIKWRDLVPERKTSSILIAQLAAFAVVVYLVARSGIGMLSGSRSEIVSYILFGDWMRGFNLFAICAIIMVVTMALLLIQVARLSLQLLSMLFDSRGETVCRLVYSLLKYVIVLGALYYSFGYLGFDARTRLTSLGIVSIALSLGAQTLVADIIAGIFIVFEGDFQVGDIIDVGGYRGTVLEIGVRSTKLMGRGYNIKIIDNRDIKNVLNMTHLNSFYPLEIKVPTVVPTERMEEILTRELPKIGAAHQDVIVSGPEYKGITSIQTGLPFPAVGYSILTECREENYFKVERIVNGEVMRILEEEDIPLRM